MLSAHRGIYNGRDIVYRVRRCIDATIGARALGNQVFGLQLWNSRGMAACQAQHAIPHFDRLSDVEVTAQEICDDLLSLCNLFCPAKIVGSDL